MGILEDTIIGRVVDAAARGAHALRVLRGLEQGSDVQAKAPSTPRAERASLSIETAPARDSDFRSDIKTANLTPAIVASALMNANRGLVGDLAKLCEAIEEADPKLWGVLQTRKLAITGADYEIVPAEGRGAKRIAAECEQMIAGLPQSSMLGPGDEGSNFMDVVGRLMDGLFRPLSASEIIWDTSSGQAWPALIKHRNAANFLYVARENYAPGSYINQLRVKTDRELILGEPLLPNKWIVHRQGGRSSYPCRSGIVRPIVRWFLFKIYGATDLAAFVEIFGTPLRVARFNPNLATPQDKAELRAALSDLGTDGSAIFSDAVTLQFENAATSGNVDAFRFLMEYVDKQYSVAILGHTGSSESTSGRLGGEDSAEAVRQDLKDADASAIAGTLRRDLLMPFVTLNHGADVAQRYTPTIHFRVQMVADREIESKIIKNAVETGLRVPSAYAYEVLGIPEPKKSEPIIVLPGRVPASDAEPPQTDASAGGAHPSPFVRAEAWASPERLTAEATQIERHQGEADGVYEVALDRSFAVWDEYLAPLKGFLERAGSYDAAIDDLDEDLFDHEIIEPLLENTQNAAYVLGRAQVLEETKLTDSPIPEAAQAARIVIEPVPAEEALEWLRDRLAIEYNDYADASAAIKARTFSLAHHEGLHTVESVKAQLVDAIDTGKSYGEFVKDYREMAARLGITPTSPFHLETVFRNATSNAYSVGRYDQMTNPMVVQFRPYWQYRTVGDANVSDICASLDGQVYAADDPIWSSIYPPNHHNCRSSVITLSDRQIQRRDLSVLKEQPATNLAPDEGWNVNPALTRDAI